MPPPALIQLLIQHAGTAKYRACVFIIILKAIALDLKNKWLGFSLFPAVFWQCLLHSRLGGGGGGGSEIEFGVWVKPIRGKGDVTGTERKMAGPSARPQQEKGRRSLTKELKDRATFSKASK